MTFFSSFKNIAERVGETADAILKEVEIYLRLIIANFKLRYVFYFFAALIGFVVSVKMLRLLLYLKSIMYFSKENSRFLNCINFHFKFKNQGGCIYDLTISLYNFFKYKISITASNNNIFVLDHVIGSGGLTDTSIQLAENITLVDQFKVGLFYSYFVKFKGFSQRCLEVFNLHGLTLIDK